MYDTNINNNNYEDICCHTKASAKLTLADRIDRCLMLYLGDCVSYKKCTKEAETESIEWRSNRRTERLMYMQERCD